MENYLEKLNPAQRAAVECTEGPVMVIAGAGSGKTRVLTYRIVHLLNQGVDPFSILTLTFTNKAAREMRERIDNLIGSESRNLWMGTFHSIFARILRKEAEKIGYPSNFTIYDSQDSKNLIKAILKDLSLDDKIYKPGLVHSRISSAKNSLITPQAYMNNTTIQSEDRQNAKPKIGEIYKIYDQRLFRSSAMDFDDLLFKTNILLRDFPDVLYRYQHQFKYLLVDEYQDTNFSQYVIVKKLAALNENICVVGDDAQSIYGFRGANIQNILNFKNDYPDVKTFKLEQNYRSTKTIVNAANAVIDLNKDQIKKEVWTDNEEGGAIKVMKASTDNEEGQLVAHSIFEQKMNFQAKNEEFAILYRTNAQSRAMEEALRKRDIPYRIYGGLSFYQRKEIKDLLSYYRLTINPNDDEALKRVINYPSRGIGKTSMERITVVAHETGQSLWNIISSLNTYNTGIGSGAYTKINDFVTMIKSFQSALHTTNAYDLGNAIASSSGMLKLLYTDRTPEGISRYENIQELLNGLKEFTEKADEEGEIKEKYLPEFMEDIALLTDSDNEDKNDRNKVSLMTIHLAKGLEFPYVHIVGLEENLFPSQMSMTSREDLEEERRLFYVALTRAEKSATLSFATSRYKWGNLIYCEPSRFIEEIDDRYLDYPARHAAMSSPDFRRSESRTVSDQGGATATAPYPSPKRKLRRVSSGTPAQGSGPMDYSKLQVGSMVGHQRFGTGKVLQLDGRAPDIKAIVEFKGVGVKKLLLKFAKLELL